MQRRSIFSATSFVLFLMCVMYGITYIDRVNVSTAASVFSKELHLSNTQVGFVFSAFAYPYLIFQIIGGWVSDKFGARMALTVSAVIWAGATLATGFAGTLTTPGDRPRFTGVWRRCNFPHRHTRHVRLGPCFQTRLCSGCDSFGSTAG